MRTGERFGLHDHQARISRLRDAIASSSFDCLFVTRMPNVRYLSGFTGSSASLLIGEEATWFFTDGRYDVQSREELSKAGVKARVVISGADGIRDDLVLAVGESGAGRLGLEAAGVTWKEATDIASWLPAIEVVASVEVVEKLRMVKDPSEIERLEAAARIGDAAFAHVIEEIEPGVTERQIALELERFMVDAGASGTSFASIVAGGERSAMPHAQPGEIPFETGEMVVLDFGCVIDGYCSDMTRTVALGAPQREMDAIYGIVQTAQAAGVNASLTGTDCAEVDKACRQLIADAGYGDLFVHSTGHGVGLEVHEAPRVGRKAPGILATGHVITVEPGIYLPGIGGVRIEDMVLIGESSPTVLTNSPKELVVL